jgi:hypothetical protein
MDLLAYERNGYQRFLPADIKHYLASSRKGLYSRVCEPVPPHSL